MTPSPVSPPPAKKASGCLIALLFAGGLACAPGQLARPTCTVIA
ncbi:MAG: hypothetical protein Q8K32_23685 [Archangium sp.]|nr:hypothetical protein [Archangium sp.]